MSQHEQAPTNNLDTYNRTWDLSIFSTASVMVLLFALYLLARNGFGAFFGWLAFSIIAYGIYRMVRTHFL